MLVMEAAAEKSSLLLHLQSREAERSETGRYESSAALGAGGCRLGVRREPLAAAISGSLCDSSRGEGAGHGGQGRSRRGRRGGAAGGARPVAGASGGAGLSILRPGAGPCGSLGPLPWTCNRLR